jgi:hypothetical protein
MIATFDLLVYADENINIPKEWEESDPKNVSTNPTHLKLRSFTTKVSMMIIWKKKFFLHNIIDVLIIIVFVFRFIRWVLQ